MKLKTETDLEPAKERGTRREVDSQVNISLYLKKPEDILEMLLISMPALRRPTLDGHGRAGGRAPGVSASWSRVTVTLPAIISRILESNQWQSRNETGFSTSFSVWPLSVGAFNGSHTGVWLCCRVWFWHLGKGRGNSPHLASIP